MEIDYNVTGKQRAEAILSALKANSGQDWTLDDSWISQPYPWGWHGAFHLNGERRLVMYITGKPQPNMRDERPDTIRFFLTHYPYTMEMLGESNEPLELSLASADENVVREIRHLLMEAGPAYHAAMGRVAIIREAGAKLAGEIAGFLGEGWEGSARAFAVRDGYYDRIIATVAKKKAVIEFVYYRWTRDASYEPPTGVVPRFEIRGQIPEGVMYHNWKGVRDVITVASTQTPKSIAGHIARRVLPTYLGDLKAAVHRQARMEQDVIETQKVVMSLIGAAKGQFDEVKLDPTSTSYRLLPRRDMGNFTRINSMEINPATPLFGEDRITLVGYDPRTVLLSLQLTPDEAVELLAHLPAQEKPHE